MKKTGPLISMLDKEEVGMVEKRGKMLRNEGKQFKDIVNIGMWELKSLVWVGPEPQ